MNNNPYCVDHSYANSHLLRCEHMFRKGLLGDVQIISGNDNREFLAHRVVLAAASEFFADIFRVNKPISSSSLTKVHLRNCDAQSVELVLNFIYSGTLPSDALDSIKIWHIAKTCKIAALERLLLKSQRDQQQQQQRYQTSSSLQPDVIVTTSGNSSFTSFSSSVISDNSCNNNIKISNEIIEPNHYVTVASALGESGSLTLTTGYNNDDDVFKKELANINDNYCTSGAIDDHRPRKRKYSDISNDGLSDDIQSNGSDDVISQQQQQLLHFNSNNNKHVDRSVTNQHATTTTTAVQEPLPITPPMIQTNPAYVTNKTKSVRLPLHQSLSTNQLSIRPHSQHHRQLLMSLSPPLSTASSTPSFLGYQRTTTNILLDSPPLTTYHQHQQLHQQNVVDNNSIQQQQQHSNQQQVDIVANNRTVITTAHHQQQHPHQAAAVVVGSCNRKYIRKIDNEMFQCTICGKSYNRYNSTSNHVTTYHRNPPIRCDFPGCTFSTREARYIHFHKFYRHKVKLPENIDTDNRQCPFCRHISKSPGMLEKHIDHHLTKYIRVGHVIKCNVCDKELSSKSNLCQHFQTHSTATSAALADSDSQKKFHCQHCAYKSRTASSLRQHCMFKHSRSKNKNNNNTNTLTTSTTTTRNKMLTNVAVAATMATAPTSHYYQCDRCSFVSQSQIGILAHEQQHHNYELPSSIVDKIQEATMRHAIKLSIGDNNNNTTSSSGEQQQQHVLPTTSSTAAIEEEAIDDDGDDVDSNSDISVT